MIPLSEPLIAGNAWRYVKDCLDTGWVSSVGAYVGRFERELERLTGAPHAVAGVNGTACLQLALARLGVRHGDAVLVPAVTFIATANAVRHCGAEPIALDCEPRRFNLSPDALEDYLENRCRRRAGATLTREGRPVRALMPVHVLGYPADMPRLLRVARGRGLVVVEDAAESIGSTLVGRHTGLFGAAGVLSFNGNKIVTSGGGGAILTGDARLARSLRHLTQQAKRPGVEYVHDAVGYNFRLTNVSAALGVSQLELLPRFLEKRRRIAAWYRAGLPGVPVEPVPAGVVWNRWLLGVQLPSLVERRKLERRLAAAGCQARPLWVPVPQQPPYRASAPATPEARRAYATVLNIPSSTSLTKEQVGEVCAVLRTASLTRALL